MPAVARIDPKDVFTAEEWARLSPKSTWRGLVLVAGAWGLIAAAGAVVPGVGQAARVPLCDQSEVCRVHRENGFQLYEAKNYGDALTEFEAAYATRAEPRLLLNIGRSLFRLDRPGEALQRGGGKFGAAARAG